MLVGKLFALSFRYQVQTLVRAKKIVFKSNRPLGFHRWLFQSNRRSYIGVNLSTFYPHSRLENPRSVKKWRPAVGVSKWNRHLIPFMSVNTAVFHINGASARSSYRTWAYRVLGASMFLNRSLSGSPPRRHCTLYWKPHLI